MGSSSKTDFAYQEMRAKLNALLNQKLLWSQMNPLERKEVSNYVKQVATERHSLTEDLSRLLPNTSWKLAFSTSDTSESLPPPGSTLCLRFHDDLKADYVLEFGDGGSKLSAESKWNYEPGTRTLSISYENLSTKIGFLNIGLGGLGMKGRTVRMTTAFVDGKFWIERSGLEDYHVYVRMDQGE